MPDTFADEAAQIRELVDLLTDPETLEEHGRTMPLPPQLAAGLAELQTLLELELAELQGALE